MVIETYARINTGRSCQEVRPYSNICNNKIYLSKFIRPYLKNITKRGMYENIVKTTQLVKPYLDIYHKKRSKKRSKSVYD